MESNLDKLIDSLKIILYKKHDEYAYILSNNFNKKIDSEEVEQKWLCWLEKNKIELAFDSDEYFKSKLLYLINHNSIKIKNKIIFEVTPTLESSYFWWNSVVIKNYFLLTTRENAQKLVVLGSFEN
jgi:hypothetical protein